MAEGGGRASPYQPQLQKQQQHGTGVVKRSASQKSTWSHLSEAHDADLLSQAVRRRDLKEYLIPLSVLHLDHADRKVMRIAGTSINVDAPYR